MPCHKRRSTFRRVWSYLGALALSPTSSISMVPLAAICYIALLFGVRIVTTKEIRRIGQAFVT